MEQSRYQEYHGLYILGFISLLLGFLFLGFAIYLIPIVFFNININVPISFFKLIIWLRDHFMMVESESIWMIWQVCLAIGILFLVIAQITSNYIDNHLLKYRKVVNPEELIEREKDLVEVKHMVLILVVAILLVLAGLKVFEATITSGTTTVPVVPG